MHLDFKVEVPASKGAISSARINLKDIDMVAMHKKIGFVMQESILFHTSIKENLFDGKDDATEAEIFEAYI